jgi:capsular exopolysaccharide synthesis family protein
MTRIDNPMMAEAGDPLAALWAIRRHWRLGLFVAVMVPGLALLALTRMQPTYTATGILLYAPADFNPKLLRGVVARNQVTHALMDSQVNLLTDRPVLTGIAARLAAAPARRVTPRSSWRSAWLDRWFPWHRRAADERSAQRAAALERVRRALRVTVEPGSQIIRVRFSDADPTRAAAAANLAMRLYLQAQQERRAKLLDHARLWLETRARQIGHDLAATDLALAQARARAGTERGVDAPLTNQAAGQLTDALIAAEARLAAAQSKIARDGGVSAASAGAAVAPSLDPLRAKAAQIAARLAGHAATEGPNYPGMRADRAALAAVQQAIGAAMARTMARDRAAVTGAAAQVAALRARLAAARDQATAASVRAAPMAQLEGQRAADRRLLQELTKQIGILDSQSLLTPPDARILSPAAAPTRPSAPHPALILAGAGALGVALAVLAMLARAALDRNIGSGEDLRAALALPCLALLPELSRRAQGGLLAADYAVRNPFSPFSEQLRALRIGISLERGTPRSIAVTAARPGEGKTTLALSLAASLAMTMRLADDDGGRDDEAGGRVLAIDCDVRQPSFDNLFDLAGAAGLTDYLAGRVDLAQAIQPSRIAGLDLMPAGAVATDALSLFLSPAMPLLLERLAERYAVVILDLPPVFALAEARVLGRLAQQTILCVRWQQTPKRIAHAAASLLAESGCVLTGSVLTRVNSARHARAGYVDSELYHPRLGGYFRL